MLAVKENPRYNIISVRLNDEEREMLDEISRKTLKTVSEIIRDAMQLATPKLAHYYEQKARAREMAQKRKKTRAIKQNVQQLTRSL